LNNFYYGTLSQTLPVKPGLITAKMRYFVTKETRTVGDTWLQMDLLDEQGAVLETFKSNNKVYSASRGKWNDLSIMGYIPDKINGVPVKQVKVSNTVNGFHEEGAQMYMDDFEVYQSAEQDPSLPIVLSGVQAANGELTAAFIEAPAETPAIGDFTVVRQLNGKAETIAPTGISWAAGENKAILSVPVLEGKIWEQSIVYKVTYKAAAPVSSAPLLIPARAEGLVQIVSNASFDQWSSKFKADDWIFWGEGFTRSDVVKRSGSSSMAADGLQPGQNEAGGGGPLQEITVEPGHYAGVFRYNTNVNTAGTLSWFMLFKDAGGNVVGAVASEKRNAVVSKGSWLPFEYEFDIPAGTASMTLQILLNDFKQGETIYFDDVEVYKIPQTTTPVNPVSTVEAAVYGNLDVTFQIVPGQQPVIGDFTITHSVNGAAAETVVPSGISWSADTRTARLTVPGLTQRVYEQSAVYRVSYQGAAAVKSSPLTLTGNAHGLEQRVQDASFEQWSSANAAEKWTLWGEGFTRSDAVKRSGSYGLAADGLQPGQNDAGGGGPYQIVPVEPGHYVGTFRYNTTVNTAGTLFWFILFKDVNGNNVNVVASERRNAAASEGNWMPFEYEFDVPEGSVSMQMGIVLKDFNQGETIYFDDAEVYKIQ
jgi:hypothetical protein